MRRRLALFLGAFALFMSWAGLWIGAVRADPGPSAPLPPDTSAGACTDWIRVNADAFGMGPGPDGTFCSEEGFEVTVYGDQLYVGMEADDALGARIWRTRPGVNIARAQEDWEEVAAVDGEPFGHESFVDGKRQNDHIDSLIGFRGSLYASTANGGSTEQGAMVYSSTTGASGSWSPVIGPGFGDVHNVNFKDMQVFHGWLCGGTHNWESGAEVWCTRNGEIWEQKSAPGFGDELIQEVWSGHVFEGALYFGVNQADADRTPTGDDDVGLLYRATSVDGGHPVWTPVFTGPVGSNRIDILGDLDGYLYISHSDPDRGIVILRSASGDGGTWKVVNEPGMDGSAANFTAVVDGATPYNGALYVAVGNHVSGAEVWRTTGQLGTDGRVDWEPVGGSGLDHGTNVYAELVVHKGYLYAWTSNYESGQQVLRTACPIVQAETISGPGSYGLDGVGATITFTMGAPDVVTVSVLPEAFPILPRDGVPVARTVMMEVMPEETDFTADLTFSYRSSELTPAEISVDRPYLMRWDDRAWVRCENEGSYDEDSRAVTCLDVEHLSPWVIAGVGELPNHVVLTGVAASGGRSARALVVLGSGLFALLRWVGLVRRR